MYYACCQQLVQQTNVLFVVHDGMCRVYQAVEQRMEEIAAGCTKARKEAADAHRREAQLQRELDERTVLAAEAEVVRDATQEQVRLLTHQMEQQSQKLEASYKKLILMAEYVCGVVFIAFSRGEGVVLHVGVSRDCAHDRDFHLRVSQSTSRAEQSDG